MKISRSKNIKIINLRNSNITCQVVDYSSNYQTIEYYKKVIIDPSFGKGFGPPFDSEEILFKRVELIVPYINKKVVGALIIEKKNKIILTTDFIDENREELILSKYYWAIRSIQIIKKYQKKGIGTGLIKYVVDEKNRNELEFPLISTMMLDEGEKLFKRFGKIYRA